MILKYGTNEVQIIICSVIGPLLADSNYRENLREEPTETLALGWEFPLGCVPVRVFEDDFPWGFAAEPPPAFPDAMPALFPAGFSAAFPSRPPRPGFAGLGFVSFGGSTNTIMGKGWPSTTGTFFLMSFSISFT